MLEQPENLIHIFLEKTNLLADYMKETPHAATNGKLDKTAV